jgi:stage II sporulation protein D
VTPAFASGPPGAGRRRHRTLAALVVALAALVTSPAAGHASGTVRVAVMESVAAVEVRGVGVEVTPVGACSGCKPGPWRTDLVRAVTSASGVEVDGRRAAGFRLRSDRHLRVNGREYPGAMDLVRNGGGLALVNEVPLEEYVAGVVRAEVGERWPPEALRAQAIAARTYAAYHRLLGAGKAYHLVASTAHQQYAGTVSATSAVWAAVRETSGQVLRWEGELFPAFYHAESGGYTEDPRLVFASGNMPALRPVVCPFSVGSPHYRWNVDLRLADLADALRRHGVDVGTLESIEVAERTLSLRATAVTLRGSLGAARLRGADFRRMVGHDVLRSTLFAVAVDGEVAHVSGRGYGHGTGLCQWGARGMAEQGYTARQILEFYYAGATLGVLDER